MGYSRGSWCWKTWLKCCFRAVSVIRGRAASSWWFALWRTTRLRWMAAGGSLFPLWFKGLVVGDLYGFRIGGRRGVVVEGVPLVLSSFSWCSSSCVGNNEQERKHCDSGTPDGTRPKTMQARPKTMKSIMKNKASRTSPARVTYADVVRKGKANKSPTNEFRAHSLETIKTVN